MTDIMYTVDKRRMHTLNASSKTPIIESAFTISKKLNFRHCKMSKKHRN